MKRTEKKLQLSVETLRQLQADELRGAAGGRFTYSRAAEGCGVTRDYGVTTCGECTTYCITF